MAGAKYNAGLSALKLNDINAAGEYLMESIRADTENEHANKSLNLLGVIHMMQQKSKKAIDYLTRSIEIDSSFADAFYNRGIAYGMLEEYAPALKDLEKSRALGKSSADVIFAIGVQKLSLRMMEEGCADLATAAEMGYDEAVNMQNKYCKNYLP